MEDYLDCICNLKIYISYGYKMWIIFRRRNVKLHLKKIESQIFNINLLKMKFGIHVLKLYWICISKSCF